MTLANNIKLAGNDLLSGTVSVSEWNTYWKKHNKNYIFKFGFNEERTTGFIAYAIKQNKICAIIAPTIQDAKNNVNKAINNIN